MHSHFFILALFALLVSVVFAALLRDEPRGQVWLGARLFAGFLVSAVALGWILYVFPL